MSDELENLEPLAELYEWLDTMAWSELNYDRNQIVRVVDVREVLIIVNRIAASLRARPQEPGLSKESKCDVHR